MATKEPKFSLALKDGAFELRDYAATVVAEVTVTGTQGKAGRAWFGRLADHILGGNAAHWKIAMTAPVTQIAAARKWLVLFAKPARYRPEDLPLPGDPALSLHAKPPARLAVLLFSGLGETKVAEATARLLAWIAACVPVVAGL